MKHPDPLAVKLAAAFISHLLDRKSVDRCIKLVPHPLPAFWLRLAAHLREEIAPAKEIEDRISTLPPRKSPKKS